MLFVTSVVISQLIVELCVKVRQLYEGHEVKVSRNHGVSWWVHIDGVTTYAALSYEAPTFYPVLMTYGAQTSYAAHMA